LYCPFLEVDENCTFKGNEISAVFLLLRKNDSGIMRVSGNCTFSKSLLRVDFIRLYKNIANFR